MAFYTEESQVQTPLFKHGPIQLYYNEMHFIIIHSYEEY